MQDLAGFFFTGAGTVPGFLFYASEPAFAILAMVALLLTGCMAGLADPAAPLRTVNAQRRPDERR